MAWVWPLACWDCWFESRRRHGRLSVVSVECCVLSGRGLCDGLITHPDVSFLRGSVWSWSLDSRRPWPTRRRRAMEKKIDIYMQLNKCIVRGLHCWVSVRGTVELLVFASASGPCSVTSLRWSNSEFLGRILYPLLMNYGHQAQWQLFVLVVYPLTFWRRICFSNFSTPCI